MVLNADNKKLRKGDIVVNAFATGRSKNLLGLVTDASKNNFSVNGKRMERPDCLIIRNDLRRFLKKYCA